ncbi:MAG: AAA family ATPase [Candidatus Eremiobacterota bacterium]
MRSVPLVESLKVQNYRALRQLELADLQPMTVLVGPNGSGKSTLFDVFAFLSECFTDGLRRAWDRRGRFHELRTRGQSGPITFELRYREKSTEPVITYHLSIDEGPTGPLVSEESLKWRRGQHGRPFKFLDFTMGAGSVVSGSIPDEIKEQKVEERLSAPDMLAVSTLGQLARHPRVSALRQFISCWHLSYLTADQTRTTPEVGPAEHLSTTGANLPNVIQYLQEQHPDRLKQILGALCRRVPRLERVDVERLADNRLLLRFKDQPFEEPILARFASDGTLKMLAYLTVLYDPSPPQLIGIEEPENHLHPRLLPQLAEECRLATAHTQLMITTHSPFLVNALRTKELWVLFRDEHGHTNAVRADRMNRIPSFMDHGAQLGHLWMEGYFEVGDPLSQ